MNLLSANLKLAIAAVIRDKEGETDVELAQKERAFLEQVCLDFVVHNVHKYVNGVKEHGPGFLTEVDHIGELYKEQLDGFNFLAAIRYKTLQHDERYKQNEHHTSKANNTNGTTV